MKNFSEFEYQTNEEFTPGIKAVLGAGRKLLGNIANKFQELRKSFSDDFKKIKSEEELKNKTIKLLKDLSSNAKKEINSDSVKKIEDIEPILKKFEEEITKIINDFKKMNESSINESFLLGARALLQVVNDYWSKFKADYAEKLKKLKEESDKKKALRDAKRLAIEFIDKTIDNSIEKIKSKKIQSQAQSKQTQVKSQTQAQSKSQTQAQSSGNSRGEEKVKAKYKELLADWKSSQKQLNKNTNPGEGTRKRLMKQAEEVMKESNVIKTFESFIIAYY